ncbi:unnamed protein product [Lupinus luteus]|uniref:Uncharacterized protein n=1 Tax=Lupinus luteus TaxID=3873 RepID=A0AAV1WTT8_LUPLU
MERKVETMDYRSSAGKEGKEERNVQVIHQPHSKSDGSDVLASAAAAVSSTIQGAKDAIYKK